MREKRHGRRIAGRLTGLIAALTAAVLLAVVPVMAKSTVTGSDVMIRNSAEEKNGEKNNIIGSLNLGDKVTVKSKTTDASGQEWYLVELPNGNTGYVKAQWVDVDGASVETQAQEEQKQEEQKPEADEQKAEEDTAVPEGAPDEEPVETTGIEDWTVEDAGNETVEADDNTEASDDGEQAQAPDTEEDQKTPEVDNGDAYDPFTDPNAQYSINYVTEKDGTGNWYIFNYDTNKRIRLGDLKELSDAQATAQKNASSTGIWRTIACILLILVIALLIFLYLIIKRNSPGGGAPSRRSRRQRRTVEEEEDEDDDFYYTGEDSDVTGETGEAVISGAALKQEAEDEEAREVSSKRAKKASGKAVKEDVPDSEEEDDAEDYDPEEEEDEAEEIDDDPDEELYDDYDEDLMEDEDGEYDDEEDQSSGGGGFLGFFKNIFSRDGLDDDYDEEDDEIEDDDFEEDDIDFEEEAEEEEEPIEEIPPVKKTRARSRRFEEVEEPAPASCPRKRPARNISFDEALDYPEDEELLSSLGRTSGNGNAGGNTPEAPVKKEAETPRAEKAVQNTQNTAKRRGPAAPAVPEDPEEEFYADDDDDMEYSFLNSPARRSPR